MLIHVRQDSSVLAMDLHKSSISAAVLEPGWESPVVDRVASDEASVRRLLGRFDDLSRVAACDEAGPTGYELSWRTSGCLASLAASVSSAVFTADM